MPNTSGSSSSSSSAATTPATSTRARTPASTAPACEAYYTEENLVDGLCPDHGTAPVHMEEDNYFFRLSAFQERLADSLQEQSGLRIALATATTRRSRSSSKAWTTSPSHEQPSSGVSLFRGMTAQVVYVWVDALINYLSALHYAPGQDLVSRFWPASYHLMAQDILKFHGIIWPALLMSAGYELPEHLFIHGYLKLGGEKMSKTRGNVMDPFPLIEQYGADPFRFYCLREVSFGQDGMVSEEGFKARYNSELANELGNLLSRTTSMIGKYRGGAVPAPPAGRAAADSPLAAEAAATAEAVRTMLDEMDLSAALETIWVLVRRLNRYVEEQAPWKLAKEATAEASGVEAAGAAGVVGTVAGSGPARAAGAALDATLWDLAEGLRLLSVLLYPFIPETAWAIRERLGLSGVTTAIGPAWIEARWGMLSDGLTVVTGAPLFPRIED